MKKSFRSTLIDTVMKSAEDYDNLVVLNADSARALKLTGFTKAWPGRMFGVGISEADMIGTAAGMAAAGLLPVIVGFSMFVSEKPFEQIRQAVAYPNLNVKIIATHSGLCVGQDGATHQALEDIAVMRALPNFKVYAAADVTETKAAVEAMLKHEGLLISGSGVIWQKTYLMKTSPFSPVGRMSCGKAPMSLSQPAVLW